MNTNRSRNVPAGYARVNPWVISDDTDAEIRFLTEAFGARERPGSRVLNQDGSIGHVEVDLHGFVIMMFDRQAGWTTTPSHLRVYADDAAETMARAVKAGAREVTRLTTLAFGERVGRLRDTQGHLWWIHERFEDVSPDELAARFADPAALRAMSYVQQSLSEELAT